MTGRRRRLAVSAALVLVLTGGCLGRSDPIRYYVLTDAARPAGVSPSAEPAKGAALGVGPITLPRYLDRPNIVTRRGAEIDVAEFDRWSEPLSEGVPRTVAANLSSLLGTDRVAVFPWPVDRDVQYQVVIDVIRFDGSLGADVLLEARWRIVAPERKDLLIRYSTVHEATGDPGYLGLVGGMSRSLVTLSGEIAQAIKELRSRQVRASDPPSGR